MHPRRIQSNSQVHPLRRPSIPVTYLLPLSLEKGSRVHRHCVALLQADYVRYDVCSISDLWSLHLARLPTIVYRWTGSLILVFETTLNVPVNGVCTPVFA